jgi:hypothetical protein
MSLKKIYDAEINPFCFLKLRQIFAWLFLFLIGILIQFLIIYEKFDLNLTEKEPLDDPLINSFCIVIVLLLTIAWLVRQCNLVGIDLKYLIGKIPPKYDWRSLIILVIATILFTKGIFRVSYYHLSFLSPSLLKHIFDEFGKGSIFTQASQSFYPLGYYLIYPFAIVISEIFNAILLFFLIFGYTNVIAGIVFILIYILLYLKTRNLVVSMIFSILNSLFFYVIDFLWAITIPQTTTNTLEQFRSEFGIGIIMTCISAPFVLGFIYKNWHYLNKELPYFANKHSSELSTN